MNEYIVLLEGSKETVSVNGRVRYIRVGSIKIVQSFVEMVKNRRTESGPV